MIDIHEGSALFPQRSLVGMSYPEILRQEEYYRAVQAAQQGKTAGQVQALLDPAQERDRAGKDK